ncbi:hypothetical protein H0H87_002366 [Tephrocybe sp. NHM501043]|nr:hypothetical protein H0H87_002366 [Tephrocybe sp. NHM501043]
MQFTFYLFALVFIVSALAAPLSTVRAPENAAREFAPLKALGGVGCNVARFKTVTGLAAASAAVKKVSAAAANDAAAADGATAATTGLNGAKAGIAKIAASLLAGQTAPADARTQTADGLNAAMDALNGINSTDPTVAEAVSNAATKVEATIASGNDVVAQC